MTGTLVVNEIYLSLQGESTFAGLPCIFIRLTACDLRCSYCDTAYAFTEGKKMSLEEIRKEIKRLAKPFLNPQSATRLGEASGEARVRNPHLFLLRLAQTLAIRAGSFWTRCRGCNVFPIGPFLNPHSGKRRR